MVARAHVDAPIAIIGDLLESPWHEERLTALIILVMQYKRGDQAIRQKLYEFYLAHGTGE